MYNFSGSITSAANAAPMAGCTNRVIHPSYFKHFQGANSLAGIAIARTTANTAPAAASKAISITMIANTVTVA